MFITLSVSLVNNVDTGSVLVTTSTFTITRCILSLIHCPKLSDWSLWQVLCGPDYEERMVFASLSSHPNQLAQLRHGGSGGHQHPSNNPQLQNQNGPSSSLPPVSCLTSSSSPAAARQRTPLPPISSVRSSLLQT